MIGKLAQYTLLKEIGVGSFGTVYLAVGDVPGRGHAPPKKRIVAIKKLHDTANQQSVALLLREFSLLDQVKHRCIVRVFEYIEKHQAVVMEYIHGVNLREIMNDLTRSKERFFTEAAIEIACELADALYQAYTTPGDNGEPLQLIHHDLKPANIILTPNGEVKVLDFGLARVDNSEFSSEKSGQIQGTPIYMAPEQVRGQHVDHRTDLFALALILYELLLGKPAYRIPVDASDPIAAIYRDISAGRFDFDFQNLKKQLPRIGPVLSRALEKRPSERYPNGQEMLIALRRQLAREHGEYVKEFARFYYDVIHQIEAMPTLQNIDLNPVAQSSQRLQKNSTPAQPAKPVTNSVQKPKRDENTQGGTMADNPKRPPVGGGASRSRPRAGAFSSDKEPGARSPDETGMLSFVPLGGDESREEEGSATEFFAIPAPKQNRQAPTNQSTPAPPPQRGPTNRNFAAPPPPNNYQQSVAGFQGGGYRPMPPPNPGFQGGGGYDPAKPPPPMIGMGNPGTGMPMIGPGVASSPVSSATTNTSSARTTEISGRSGSQRVYVILIAVVGIILSACIFALVLAFNGDTKSDPTTKKPVNNTPVASAQVYEEPSAEEAEPEVEEAAPRVERRRRSSRRGKKREKAPKPAKKEKKEPKGNGTLRVRASGDVLGISLSCSGYRKRKSGKSATFTGVPKGRCKLKFSPSGATYSSSSLGSRSSVSCSLSSGGAIANCR